jgi:hypothetical protein
VGEVGKWVNRLGGGSIMASKACIGRVILQGQDERGWAWMGMLC